MVKANVKTALLTCAEFQLFKLYLSINPDSIINTEVSSMMFANLCLSKNQSLKLYLNNLRYERTSFERNCN